MSDVGGWFAMGGVWMYVVLGLALIGLPGDLLALLVAVIARFVGGLLLSLARVIAVGALLFSALPGIAGLVGWWAGTRAVDAALAMVSPEIRAEVAAQGYAEARVPLLFGGVTSAVLLALAFVACVVALWPRRAAAEAD